MTARARPRGRRSPSSPCCSSRGPSCASPCRRDDHLREPRSRAAALELAEERDRALAALKELEFDHRTGKLTDADYRELVGPYRRRAAAALRALDASDGRARTSPRPSTVPPHETTASPVDVSVAMPRYFGDHAADAALRRRVRDARDRDRARGARSLGRRARARASSCWARSRCSSASHGRKPDSGVARASSTAVTAGERTRALARRGDDACAPRPGAG